MGPEPILVEALAGWDGKEMRNEPILFGEAAAAAALARGASRGQRGAPSWVCVRRSWFNAALVWTGRSRAATRLL